MAAYFLVKFENSVYANGELYRDAVAKGETAFRKMLSSRAVTGKALFDQVLYPVTPEQKKECESYNPAVQDFDDAVRHFNILSKETLRQIKGAVSEAFYNAHVIAIDPVMLPQRFKYKYTAFFKVRDWDYAAAGKYHALSKMAAVKVCGFLYVAINAVDIRAESPIIAALKY